MAIWPLFWIREPINLLDVWLKIMSGYGLEATSHLDPQQQLIGNGLTTPPGLLNIGFCLSQMTGEAERTALSFGVLEQKCGETYHVQHSYLLFVQNHLEIRIISLGFCSFSSYKNPAAWFPGIIRSGKFIWINVNPISLGGPSCNSY